MAKRLHLLHLCLLCVALLGVSQRSAAQQDWQAILEQGRARYSNFAGGIPAPLALTSLKTENPGIHQDLAAIAVIVATTGQNTIVQAHAELYAAIKSTVNTSATTEDWMATLRQKQDDINKDMKQHVDKAFDDAIQKIGQLQADQRAAAAEHYNSLAGSVSHVVDSVIHETLGSLGNAFQDFQSGFQNAVHVFLSTAENVGRSVLNTITSWF